jgi:hypothetical protein
MRVTLFRKTENDIVLEAKMCVLSAWVLCNQRRIPVERAKYACAVTDTPRRHIAGLVDTGAGSCAFTTQVSVWGLGLHATLHDVSKRYCRSEKEVKTHFRVDSVDLGWSFMICHTTLCSAR